MFGGNIQATINLFLPVRLPQILPTQTEDKAGDWEKQTRLAGRLRWGGGCKTTSTFSLLLLNIRLINGHSNLDYRHNLQKNWISDIPVDIKFRLLLHVLMLNRWTLWLDDYTTQQLAHWLHQLSDPCACGQNEYERRTRARHFASKQRKHYRQHRQLYGWRCGGSEHGDAMPAAAVGPVASGNTRACE